MSLKDLQNINLKDLQNFDWSTVKDRLLSNQNMLVNLIICLITLSTVLYALGSWRSAVRESGNEIVLLKKKAKAVKDHKMTEAKMAKFTKNIDTSVSGSRLIELLSEVADKSGVQIVSLSSPIKKTSPFVILTSTDITASTDNYADLVNFVREIEQSNYMMRVSEWSGSLKRGGQSTRRYGRSMQRRTEATATSNDNIVEAKIKIDIVELKID